MSLSELNVCKFPYATVCVLTRVPGLALETSPAGHILTLHHTPSIHNRVDEQGCVLADVFFCCDCRALLRQNNFSVINKEIIIQNINNFPKKVATPNFL